MTKPLKILYELLYSCLAKVMGYVDKEDNVRFEYPSQIYKY